MDSFLFYFKEGLFHVLDWNAYDHILFLVVLTVPYLISNWKKLFTLVTVFTIGHTLTLAMSAYGVIRVNSSLVEILIPVTILITALYNIFTAGKKNRNQKIGIHIFAALFFGLIHGLGFSTYFKMMTASTDSKLLPLLEYTLGIESAQIIIVLVVLIVSFIGQSIFRFSLRDWVMVISSIVIGVAIPVFQSALSNINF
ncbi:HupE/UreJ family protein [uncultured Dokdonia sp.]|uniref:HupE/UreJ family protein n=1 Tax=Dokdonia sp. Asnod2-E02 TaxID=3160574 RepID=UPI00261B7F5D|nr:HupE/UreJ family protein [uncultured Dokdonia sp.]